MLLCAASAVQAANPFFPRDVGRTNLNLAAMIDACVLGPNWKACELDRHTDIETYASQWGKTPQQLADDLRSDQTKVVACTGTIRTSGVDESGRFTQWTRACRPGEMIAILPDGQEVALECGNWKESEQRKAEVPPPPPPPAMVVVRKPDCEDGPPVSFQSGGSDDIFGGISTGSPFAGMGVGGAAFNGVVFNGCK